MTIETDTYPNLRAYHNAQKRGSIRHSNGFSVVSTSSNKLEIIWSNDVKPVTPNRQLTESQYIADLARRDRVDIV